MNSEIQQDKKPPVLRKSAVVNKRTILKLATVLLTVAVLVFSFYLVNKYTDVLKLKNISESSEKTYSDGQAVSAKRVEIKKNLDAIIKEGNVQAGEDYLDEQIKSSDNNEEKSRIFIEKAVLSGSYISGSDNEKALEYAYQAEEYYPDDETAYLIAFYEEKLDNLELAVKYYRLFLERLPEDSSGEDVDYYNNYIKELESKM